MNVPYENSAKIFIIGLLLLNFFFLAYYSHATNLNCVEIDQSAYLSTAIWLKEHGGPANFLKLCFTGEYKEENRHPFYILLISSVASRDIRFFTRAKLVSTLIAFLFIIVFFFFVRREFGFLVSVISVGLLISGEIFVRYFSWVACEYLLITFTFLTWYFTTKGFENNKLWIWAGAFNGAAFMSKSSGFFFLLAFILASIIIGLKNKSIKNLLKNKYFYFYFLAFILASAPLLIRNIIVYGNPIHTRSAKIMWLDNFEQRHSPELMEKASLMNYLKTHSVGNIAERFLSQMRIKFYLFRASFQNATIHFENYYSEQMYILVLLIVSIIYLIADKNNCRTLYNISLCTIFWLILCFTKGGTGPRIFMPLTSIFLIYTTTGSISISKKIMKLFKIKEINYNNIITLFAIVLLILSAFTSIKMVNALGPPKNPLDMYAFADGEEELANWMRKNLKDTDVIYQTPNLEPYILTSGLFFPIKGQRKNIPLLGFEGFAELLKTTQATYVILVRGRFDGRGNLFKNYIENDPENGLYIKKIPWGWQLEHSDQERPTDFLVFKLEGTLKK